MLKFATLASGSSGNCAVASDGRTHILIDAGISARRITAGLRDLGLDPRGLAGVLITHEHTDHVGGLPVLCRQLGVELYTAEPTALALCRKTPGLEPRFRVFDPGESFALGDLAVSTFPTSHDCACPVGYALTDGARKLALCTDLGVVTRAVLEGIRGAHLLTAEFNYDPEMLQSGPYPPALKARIAGDRGHLSNEMGGRLTRWAVEQGAARVVLAHLSQENNLPSAARRAAEGALASAGIRVGADVAVTVAPRSEGSGWMEV